MRLTGCILLVVVGAWLYFNLVGWAGTRFLYRKYQRFPFTWRVVAGPWSYFDWIGRT